MLNIKCALSQARKGLGGQAGERGRISKSFVREGRSGAFMESRACRWVSAGSLRVPAIRLARAMHSSLKTCGTLCWGTVQHVRPPVLFFAMHLNKWIFFCFKEGNRVFLLHFLGAIIPLVWHATSGLILGH